MDPAVPIASSPRLPKCGDRLGRYQVRRSLGHGGMAELYEAVGLGAAPGFQKRVALKLLLPHLSRDPEIVRMFLNEARWAARLEHPNIAAVFDLGCIEGEYFIAMELVEGCDLRALLAGAAAAGEPFPIDVAIHVVRSVASALSYAHEWHGADGERACLLHRDVSPSNVLVRRDGVVKLADFGLVKALDETRHTTSGVIKGKIGYLAPERIEGRAMDPRADVFALGVVMYEVLCGRRCFAADNEFALMNRVARGEYVPIERIRADVPPVLVDIVCRALAVDPAQRTPSAAVLAADLDRAAASLGLAPSDVALSELVARVGVGLAPADGGETQPRSVTLVATEPRMADPPTRRRHGLGRLAVAGAIGVAAMALGIAALSRDATPGPISTAAASAVVDAPSPTPVPAPAAISNAVPEPTAITQPAAPPAVVEPTARPEPARARGGRSEGKRTPAPRPRTPAKKASHLDRLFLE